MATAAFLTLVRPITLALSTPEACALFGRLAEPKLHLDSNVGACCHSACSDCEWRDPTGGYRFDVLAATKRKWIPAYVERDFADERGCHSARWADALFPDKNQPITLAQFQDSFQSLDYDMPMGPRGNLKPEQAQLSDEAVGEMWAWLTDGADTLTVAMARARFQAMSLDTANPEGAVGEGPDSIVWKEFATAFGVVPTEMIMVV